MIQLPNDEEKTEGEGGIRNLEKGIYLLGERGSVKVKL